MTAKDATGPAGTQPDPDQPLPPIPAEFLPFFKDRYPGVNEVFSLQREGGASPCQQVAEALTGRLAEDCRNKEFEVFPFPTGGLSPATGTGTSSGTTVNPKADLVILIDTSVSMNDEAEALSAQAAAAIETARQECTPDLRVSWLALSEKANAPIFSGLNTNFTTTIRGYLAGLNPPVNPGSIQHSGEEDGANAIIDIVRFYDWRPGARRLILFLGDEGLFEGDPVTAEDIARLNAAIQEAQANQVSVFTYLAALSPGGNLDLTLKAHYERLANETGGEAYTSVDPGIDALGGVLEGILCRPTSTPSGDCTELVLPDLKPLVTLCWGDGPNDRIETDDLEYLCIHVKNPYSNVILKNLRVYLGLATGTTTDGLPAPLPDGSRSVEVRPRQEICFGDLTPCNTEGSSASREFVLSSRGAIAGDYLLLAAYCFNIEVQGIGGDFFRLELVKS